MKITHFQRKSIMVVNMSERYLLILRGTFFGRTLSSPDLLIKRRSLKASRPCGILLTVSVRSDVESTSTTPLPSFTSVEDSLSSSKRLRASGEFTRRSLEFAEFMSYSGINISSFQLVKEDENINLHILLQRMYIAKTRDRGVTAVRVTLRLTLGVGRGGGGWPLQHFAGINRGPA